MLGVKLITQVIVDRFIAYYIINIQNIDYNI
jgi:hypothetical protein